MLKREYDGQEDCPIAQTLEVVGERWTLLIIRDAATGLRRFDEFRESLGIARNVLTDRLNLLVDEGILERAPYGERPDRYDYLLTRKGRELVPVLRALRMWGERHQKVTPAGRGHRAGGQARGASTVRRRAAGRSPAR